MCYVCWVAWDETERVNFGVGVKHNSNARVPVGLLKWFEMGPVK